MPKFVALLFTQPWIAVRLVKVQVVLVVVPSGTFAVAIAVPL
jgi:hypothetical protein